MFFYTFMPKLFNMSLTASVAIVLVVLLRLLLKKAPKVISYALWGVVLFRLLCPVSIGSNFSLYNLFDAPTEESGTMTSVIEYVPSNIVHSEYPSVALPVPGISDAINEALPQGREQLVADPLEAPMSIATYVWMIGVLGMVIYSIVSYVRLRRKLSVVVPLRDNIFIADDIMSPFVVGLFRPKIYLPCNLGDKEQEYIILHEQHHIKRLDHVMKALAFLALAIHWFNPLVWVAFVLASKDMEMSCDEAVIRKVDGDVRADYSASLLTLATGRRIIAGTPLAFGEGDTKGRINNLSKWKKPAVWVMLAALVVFIMVVICLSTNPVSYSESIRVNGVIYTQDGDDASTLPEGSTEIGILQGVYHRSKELPDKDYYATNIDEKYAGCPIYQSGAEFAVIYLEDFAGFYIPFRAEQYGDFEEAITDAHNKNNVQVFDVYPVDAKTVFAGFTTGNDLSFATFEKNNQGEYKMRGRRGFGGASLYSMTIMQEQNINQSITVALSRRSDLAKVTAQYGDMILEKSVNRCPAMIVFEWQKILPKDATVTVRFYNAENKELERIDGPADEGFLMQTTSIDELIPGTTYVSWQCLYMNPLSSYAAMGGDSGYKYVISDRSFTILSRNNGNVVSINSRPNVDTAESTPVSYETDVEKWSWQEFPYTDEEWAALYVPGGFGAMKGISQLYDEILYQPIEKNRFLLRVDGDLWLVELKNNPQMGTYLWSIYSLVPESAMGVAQWELTNYNSRLPVFRFEFDLDYDEISAVCTESDLVAFDADGKPSDSSMLLKAGDVLYWSPLGENGVPVTYADIHFSVHKDGVMTYAGTIYIESTGGGNNGRPIYTASLVGTGLHLSPNTEYEGGVISAVNASVASPTLVTEHDLRTGGLEVHVEDLDQYVFFTNSEKIAIEVRSASDFEGEIVLHDISQSGEGILFAKVDTKDNEALFNNLTSARMYRLSCEGLDGCTLVITEE